MHILFIALLLLIIFTLASFFFALAETTLFSLSRWQTERLAEHSPKKGGLVNRLTRNPQDLLAATVLGNTLANAGIVATAFWLFLFMDWKPWVFVVLVFSLILLGCEVVPKVLAVRQPERWALAVSEPMVFFQRHSKPLRELALMLNNFILKLFRIQGKRPRLAYEEEEYQELLEMAYQQGNLAASEKEIILAIINLDRQVAKDVMRPRSQMALISDELSHEEMINAARRFKHRRLPIYDETPDTIVGILNTRTLLLNPDSDLAESIEFPSFVPESMNLLQLFSSLQQQQRGMAVVLDEFAGTAGLVTMEDILEQVVGEIRSEGEEQGFIIEKLAPGKWRVNGIMRVEDFRREYPQFETPKNADTMGGLLVALLEIVPQEGEKAVYRGLQLTALKTDQRRVKELMVEVSEKKSAVK